MGCGKDEMKGYEFLHGSETMGSEGSRGIKIFAMDSKRPFTTYQKRTGRDGLSSDDRSVIYKAAEMIEKGLWLNTALRDPEGPAKAQRYEWDVTRAFFDAGLYPIYVQRLPCGYCKEPCCIWKPWFIVTCEFGHVRLGWRKSVVHLDWVNTTIENTGDEIFPDSTSTKGNHLDRNDDHKGRMIHCWGFGDVVKVLKDLRGWNRLILGTHYPKMPFGDYRDHMEE